MHLATPGPLPWAALAAAGALGIATTSDFRTNFHQYTRHYGLGLLAGPALGLMRRFHNLTRRTFVPTQAARRELAAAGFHELTVVGRGVDTERFTPAARSEALRAQWQAGPETPVLLAVGRIAAEKNIELALRAFERARRDRPDLRMVVVGDGPARARLTAAHPAATLRRREARRRAGGALRLGRRVPVPEPLRHLRQRRHGGARLRPAGGLVRLRRGRRARRRRHQRPPGRCPATKPASSPRPPRSRSRRPRCNPSARPPSPRPAAPPGTKCSSASKPAFRTPSMRSKRRLPPFPSWPEQQAIWRHSEHVLRWLERERLVALWMHGASTRAWVVRALTTVSTAGDGWIWYAIIAALPWWGGPIGGSAAARMIGVGVVNLILYKIIKRWIARPRPYRVCQGFRAVRPLARRIQLPERPHPALGRVQLHPDGVLPGVRDLRLAVHAAARRLADHPRPALPERRDRRRPDRPDHRGGQLQPAVISRR